MNKKISAILGSGLLIISSFTAPAWAEECLKAKGKIANNVQDGGATLGVAAVKLGNKKLNCAVSGEPQGQIPNGPNFRHTLVCDDNAANGEPQSQITLNTFFVADPVPTGQCEEGNPFGPVPFSFVELSIPDPATARGNFVGVDPALSSITITGDYNCKGGINMKFDGLLCFFPE